MAGPVLRYFDSSAFIMAACLPETSSGVAAKALLDDPETRIVSSIFARIEVIPRARRPETLHTYAGWFARVEAWAIPDAELGEVAFHLARTWGLSAMDAFHAASALSLGADEFVTGEKAGKPLHRVPGLVVRRV